MKLRRVFGIAAAGVAVVVGIAIIVHYHRLAVRQHAAQAALRDVISASRHELGRTYTGSAHGFHWTIIATAAPTKPLSVSSRVSGNFVLTYDGLHPPSAILWYFVNGRSDTGSPSVVLDAKSETKEPWVPIRVGTDRYVYWIIHWNHMYVPFTPKQWRTGLRTSAVQLHLGSGRNVLIPVKIRP